MNNINASETSRAVVADTKSVRSSQSSEAATLSTQRGNSLPVNTDSSDAVRKASAKDARQSSERSVEQAVEQLNDYVQSLQRDLKFSVDRDLGRAVVHVVDRNTDEVIRQIPNETALRLARNLKDQNTLIQGAEVSGSAAQSLESSLGLINTRI